MSIKLPTAYLQYSNGIEINLTVTTPEPEDGTYCIHLTEELPDLMETDGSKCTKWIRIVP